MKGGFRGNAKTISLLTVLCALAMTLSLLMPAWAQVDNQDLGSGGGGGRCTYCDYSNCGCAAPPAGQTGSFSCGCSSIDCWRSCSYY